MAFTIRATEKVASLDDDEELRKHGYIIGSTLGEGSYAKVKSAFSEKVNKKVALKIINKKKAPKDFQQKFMPRELQVMRMIHHPNIIQLYEVIQINKKVSSLPRPLIEGVHFLATGRKKSLTLFQGTLEFANQILIIFS